MRRLRTLWIPLLVSAMLAVALPASAQDRSIVWEVWDVTIDDVDTQANSFNVSEYYEITFNGTFRFGSAVIPVNNLEEIRNAAVYEDGRLLRQSCAGGQGTYCVSNTDEGLSIVYNFNQPITNDIQAFEITYSVIGGLRVYEGGDQLWWDAIPTEHFGFPIRRATVSVELPAGFAPREGVDPVETYGASANVQVNGTRVFATSTGELGGDEGLSLRVQYPHDPSARVPAWQQSFDTRREYQATTQPIINLGLLALTALIGLGGPLLCLIVWRTRGVDPQTGPTPDRVSEPPSALPPAIVGTLIDERVDTRDILSTIIDLGRRGYLVIENEESEGLFGMKSRDFTFKRTDKAIDDLRPFEKRLVSTLFVGDKLERTLDSLRERFYLTIPQLQRDLYDEVVSSGFFTRSPEATRQSWSAGGVGLLILAVGLFGAVFFFELTEYSPFVALLPFALGFTGIVALLFAQAMPVKTREGTEQAKLWKGFLNYLLSLEKLDDLSAAAAKFNEYLPYTVAFGIDKEWMNRFKQVQTEMSLPLPAPYWYSPVRPGRGRYVPGTPYLGGGYGRGDYGEGGGLEGGRLPGELAEAGGDGGLDDLSDNLGGGLDSLSDALGGLLNSAGSAMTSRPSSNTSSGSSGRWSSGGRSFSGGGGGGGGGSGGGSRGFG